jgi:hypothetical protein
MEWSGFWNDAVPEAGAPMAGWNGFWNERRAGGRRSEGRVEWVLE